MYRHPHAVSIDLSLTKPLSMYAKDGFISEEVVLQIDNYKKLNLTKLSTFEISYDLSGGYLYIGFDGRGKIEELALSIMPFLNFCMTELDIYISSSAPYYMSWGDYESGAIYFETNEEGDNNKAIITGISSNGDIVVSTIPWKY